MRRVLLRLALTVVVAAVAAVASVIAITLVDLYLVGHGHAGISKEIAAWPASGVSAGDLILLGATLLAAAAAWTLSGRRR